MILYAKDLYSAKQVAIKELKLSIMSQSLLSIAPGYADWDPDKLIGWIALYAGKRLEIHKIPEE